MSEASQNPSKTSIREFASNLSVEEVITAVKRQPLCDSRGWQITGFPYPEDDPLVYVKYGDNNLRSRDLEVQSHQFAYKALYELPQDQRQDIHIPEVYLVFQRLGSTYIIMEYISGRTLSSLLDDWSKFRKISQQTYDKIEQALRLFLAFQVPKAVPPGPPGGGIIRHPLFNSYCAPIEYDSTDMLEQHLNKVATVIRSTAPTVSLERDLHFVFSDLYEGNFMFTDAGSLFVIDFEQAAFLPLSFMSFAMLQQHHICGVLRGRLPLPSRNTDAMRHICSLFMKSSTKIGLPLDKSRTMDGGGDDKSAIPYSHSKKINSMAQISIEDLEP